MMQRPDTCDWSDVQGLVATGYGKLRHAAYLVFAVADPVKARAFLSTLLPEVTSSGHRPSQRALNVAVTYQGIRQLSGAQDDEMCGFSCAFKEGMIGSPHRSRILGDVGASAPTQWYWGQPDREVHGLLMAFESEPSRLFEWTGALRSIDSGLHWITELNTHRQDDREPFGFVDGLSQPVIEGTHAAKQNPTSKHLIRLGEMVLGYEDNCNIEQPVPSVRGDREFGLNGTYLVARQIQQHYDKFWAFMASAGTKVGLSAQQFAARVIGRTMDGDVLRPAGRSAHAGDNEFDFVDDRAGHGCPLGAHIRRGNPRDMLADDPAESWRITNRHRLLRRGRSYGDRHSDTGLMFVVLNADIERQFEFIQQNWINDPGFAELRNERDPLVGNRNGDDIFTIPASPLRHRVAGLNRFVTTKGGAYFFLPGMRALRHLAGEQTT